MDGAPPQKPERFDFPASTIHFMLEPSKCSLQQMLLPQHSGVKYLVYWVQVVSSHPHDKLRLRVRSPRRDPRLGAQSLRPAELRQRRAAASAARHSPGGGGHAGRGGDKRLADRGKSLETWLGPPTRCPFTNFFWGEGSPTKIDCRKRGALILTSLLGGPRWVCRE